MKKYSILVFFLGAFLFSNAQYDTDLGVRLGMAMYMGDIGGPGPAKSGPADIQFNQSKIHFGLTGRRFFSPAFAAQASFNYGIIGATDEVADEPTRYSRNLSFKNSIMEFSVRGEYHLLRIRDVGRTFRFRLDFSTFIFAGLGVFYNNPKAELNGTWHALQPLQTEGKSYGKIQPSIPIGVGLQFRIDKHHIIGWDFGARMTFTDYIDDVSGRYLHHSKFDDPTALALQDRSIELEGSGDPLFIGSQYFSYGSNENQAGIRGNKDSKDWYAFTAVTYSYALKNKRRSFKRKKYSFVKAKVKRRRSRAKF